MAVATASGHASEGDFDRVLVVDFGAQYAQLIARRVREARVFSEIVPRTVTAAEIKAKAPVGIILSGGPASVYADDAYDLDPEILNLGIPVLGICYGHQVLANLPVPFRIIRSSPRKFACHPMFRTVSTGRPGSSTSTKT